MLGPEWVPIAWNNNDANQAMVYNWQIWVHLSALIKAVEREGYTVTKNDGTCTACDGSGYSHRPGPGGIDVPCPDCDEGRIK